MINTEIIGSSIALTAIVAGHRGCIASSVSGIAGSASWRNADSRIIALAFGLRFIFLKHCIKGFASCNGEGADRVGAVVAGPQVPPHKI